MAKKIKQYFTSTDIAKVLNTTRQALTPKINKETGYLYFAKYDFGLYGFQKSQSGNWYFKREDLFDLIDKKFDHDLNKKEKK